MPKPLKTRNLMFNQELKGEMTPAFKRIDDSNRSVFGLSSAEVASLATGKTFFWVTPILADKLAAKGETVVSANFGRVWVRTLADATPWNDQVIDDIAEEDLGPQRNLESVVVPQRLLGGGDVI